MRVRTMVGGMCAVVMAGCGMVATAQPAAAAPAAPAPVRMRAEVPLWADGAPGSEGKTGPEVITLQNADGEHAVTMINNPSLTPYLVRGSGGARGGAPVAAVIIAPGGAHRLLSIDHEGYDVAKYLSGHGVAAFVLKYRLARQTGSTYTIEKDEMADVQRAIRLVRARAAEWGVDPARVGIMGFSAGGELAVRAAEGYHADGTFAGADDIDKQSDKPSFEVLMYPGGLTAEMIAKVTKDMPPGFLLCGADDSPAIAQQLPELFVAMRKAGVSAELHEYAGVGHGFGIRLSAHGGVADWPQLLVQWMETKGFLGAHPPS
jgi:acetyl esterase/lipase